MTNLARPSVAQWKALHLQMLTAYSPAYLRIDGYLVLLEKVQVDESRAEVLVLVDGQLKGDWIQCQRKESELLDVPRRFYARSRKAFTPPAALKVWEAIDGRAVCRARGLYDLMISTFPYWRSPILLIDHLKRHNRSIEIISRDQYCAAMASNCVGEERACN